MVSNSALLNSTATINGEVALSDLTQAVANLRAVITAFGGDQALFDTLNAPTHPKHTIITDCEQKTPGGPVSRATRVAITR